MKNSNSYLSNLLMSPLQFYYCPFSVYPLADFNLSIIAYYWKTFSGIIHGVVGTIFGGILIAESLLFSMAFYKTFYSDKTYFFYRPVIRILWIAMKAFICIASLTSNIQILNYAIIALCSAWSMYLISQSQYYHDDLSEKINLFALCMLFLNSLISIIGKVVQGVLNSMIFIASLFASYVLMDYILKKRDIEIEKKMKDLIQNQLHNYKDITQITMFMQCVCSKYSVSRCNLIKYIGLIGMHNKYCSSCILDTAYKNIDFTKGLVQELGSLQYAFVATINKVYLDYFDSWRQVKNIIKAKLSYISFLVWSKTNIVQAMTEMKWISEDRLEILQLFELYQYKLYTERAFAESFEDIHGISKVITYQTRWREFRTYLRQATSTFDSFWLLISENNPDLVSIFSYLKRISHILAQIEDTWNNLSHLNGSSNKMLLVYSIFRHKVLNDYDCAFANYSLLKESSNIKSSLQLIKENSKYKLKSKLKKQGTPYLCISSVLNQVGIITSGNISACRLFGLPKQTLIGKHMNILFPDIYCAPHKSKIESLLNNEKLNSSKEITGFAKHSSGYLIKVSKRIGEFPSIINGAEYLVIFEEQHIDDQECYLLTDQKHNLVGMTSTTINLLNINKSAIIGSPSISELMPNLKITPNTNSISLNSHSISLNTQKIYEDCTYDITEILMNNELIGYLFNFSKKNKKQVINNVKKTAFNVFQFIYNEESNKYIRQINTANPDNDLANTSISSFCQKSKISESSNKLKKEDEKSTIDESYLSLINKLEQSNSKYYIEVAAHIKAIKRQCRIIPTDIESMTVIL